MIQQLHFWVFYPKESKAGSQRDISSPMFVLFAIAKNENSVISINRWMDKEIMIYTYSGILLSLLKKGNSPMCDNVDEPWGHYAKCNGCQNWRFWTVVLEKTLESSLDCKKIQPVHLKGDQSWVFIGRTDVEAEIPTLWPPDVKSWLIWKDPDAGKDWGQEEKGAIEDEMVGWHHQLNGHEFGWTLGVGDGQGGLVCCGSWGHKESDMTERLNWIE